MAHVEGEIIINRPVEEVFDFVADERNEPLYNPEMVRSEKSTGRPFCRHSCGQDHTCTLLGKGPVRLWINPTAAVPIASIAGMDALFAWSRDPFRPRNV